MIIYLQEYYAAFKKSISTIYFLGLCQRRSWDETTIYHEINYTILIEEKNCDCTIFT